MEQGTHTGAGCFKLHDSCFMRIVAVIPAWNEERTIQEVVRSVRERAAPLVVDDGSADRTAALAREAGAVVVRHPVNRGLGAALGTGIAGALALGADVILTIDADGQHAPEDVPAMIAPILEGRADATIGTRFSGKGHMPFLRRAANRIGNLVTATLFGVSVTDSQSGFRAFSAEAARKLRIRTDRMEVSSEIIAEIREHGLRLVEVPVTAVYTAYSLSKGQGLVMGLRTLGRLVAHRARR